MSHGRLNQALNVLFLLLMVVGGYFFISHSDPVQLRASLDKISWPLILSLWVLNIASIFLVGLRFAVLVNATTPGLNQRSLARITLVSLASGYASVGKISAPIKALLLKKMHAVPISGATPMLAVEQLLDLAALGVLFLLAVALSGGVTAQLLAQLHFDPAHARHIAYWGTGLVALLMLAAWLARKHLPFLDRMFVATFTLAKDHATMRKVIYISAAIHALNVFTVAATLYLLNLPISFSLALLLTTVPLIAGLASPVPGGLGVREVVFATMYGICCGGGTLALFAIVLMRVAFFVALPSCFLFLRFVANEKAHD